MKPSDQIILEQIALQAGEWFVANQSAVRDDRQNAAFVAWLKASPLHVKSYLRVARIMRNVRTLTSGTDVSLEDLLAQARVDDDEIVRIAVQRPREPPARRAPLSWGWPRIASMAVAIGVLAMGALWWEHRDRFFEHPVVYHTAHGGQMTQYLPDGSLIRLDSDSAVAVRYSNRERLVELISGRSFFQVAHDNRRRFRVSAGNAGAIAVGTRFQVSRHATSAIVTVEQGQVAVFAGAPMWLSRGTEVPPDVPRVVAGYELHVDADVVAAQPVHVDLTQSLGWLEHKIVFEHRPLSEVAEEFNRYSRIPLEVEDPALRVMPLSGSFALDDVDSFVAYLGTLPAIRIARTDTRIRILKDTPTNPR